MPSVVVSYIVSYSLNGGELYKLTLVFNYI